MKKELIAIGGSKSYDRGVTVEFETMFADGTREALDCQAANLAKIIVKLRQIAYGAAKSREGMSRPDQLINPFEVTQVTRWGAGMSGKVGIEMAVSEGMPLRLAMSQETAASLISTLRTALTASQNPQKPRAN